MRDDPLKAHWHVSGQMSEDRIRECVSDCRAAGVELHPEATPLHGSRHADKTFDAVVLPSESGDRDPELAAVIERFPDVPVIALTSVGGGTDAAHENLAAIRQGADEVLAADTLTGDALARAIRSAIERRDCAARRLRGGTLEEKVHERTLEIEMALRESEDRFRALFDNAAVGMDLCDAGPRARILQANSALAEMLGYSRRELIGKRIAEITHSADGERDRLLYRELISGERDRYHTEKRYVHKDGAVVWGHTSVSLIRDENGQPAFTVGVVADITPRKQAEAAIRTLERQIIDLPLEERRRIGIELHDGLGQELTGLSLLARGIASDFTTRGLPHAELVQQFAAATQRMIGRIRSISRGLDPVDFDSEGLMAALDELASATRKHTGIECRFYCKRPVRIDDKYVAHHVYRIVQEAVANAVKHGDTRKISIDLGTDPEGIEVSVKNDGRPIPREEVRRSGSGLEIMRYRANLVGAVLRIEPEEAGEGTVVTCMLRKDQP
jgi:PAS domain S-box-containing protein